MNNNNKDNNKLNGHLNNLKLLMLFKMLKII